MLADVVDRADVRVIERRRGPGLALESLPRLVVDLTIKIATQGGDALQVDRWLAEAGLWESHVSGFPFNDFSIEQWEGYFVNAGQASTFVP